MANAFVWYFYAASTLEQVLNKITADPFARLQLWSIHFSGIVLSAFIGSIFSSKTKKRTSFIRFWMILGVVASLVPLVVNIYDILTASIIAGLWGICLGVGMPSCMGYYTNATSVDNRGRLGGLTMLISGLGIFLVGVVNVESILLRVIILSIWRFSGLALFLIKPSEEISNTERKHENISYKTIFSQRPFILYFVPWIMFSLLTYLSTPIRLDFLERQHIEYLPLIANGLFGLFAIIGGFLADTVGRKRITTVGFVTLGLAYAIVGMFPEQLGSWYFHTVADAVAWGFFFVVFVITVWGDLSYDLPSDKYYAVGLLPFFISKFLQLTVEESIIGTIAPSAIFSFTALFLFLAVLPLIYAPETLPEKYIREKELKSYIEKAQKEATKAQPKETENNQEENEDAEVEFEANQKDYEEILKEAEKYY